MLLSYRCNSRLLHTSKYIQWLFIYSIHSLLKLLNCMMNWLVGSCIPKAYKHHKPMYWLWNSYHQFTDWQAWYYLMDKLGLQPRLWLRILLMALYLQLVITPSRSPCISERCSCLYLGLTISIVYNNICTTLVKENHNICPDQWTAPSLICYPFDITTAHCVVFYSCHSLTQFTMNTQPPFLEY